MTKTSLLRRAVTAVFKAIPFVVLIILAWPVAYGGIFQMTVVNGSSMNPTYTSGDIVISRGNTEYAAGDIVVYHPNDLDCDRCNIVHRLTGGDSASWIAQGDNNPNIDPWSPSDEEILGKVIVHLPTAPAAAYLFAPKFWFTILLLSLGSLAMWQLWGLMFSTPESEASEEEEEGEVVSDEAKV